MDLHQAMDSREGMSLGYGGMEQSGGQPGGGHQQVEAARNVVEELKTERTRLDPSLVHCIRWLDEEIEKLANGNDSDHKQSRKIYIPFLDQKNHNLVGRLLGPKGLTLKRIQVETNTKMSILGRGSMRDKQKEEELRSSSEPAYKHLHDDLHVLIEAIPPHTTQKIAAGVAEVQKMLIPVEPGQPDFASKYENPSQPAYPSMGGHSPHMSSRRLPRSGRGGPRSGPRGGSRGGPRGRGRGGPSQGRPSLRSRPSPSQSNPQRFTRDYGHGYEFRSDGSSNNYSSDSFGTAGSSYYNSFSDAPLDGGSYGGGGGPARSAHNNFRHHPYQSHGGGSSERYF